MGNLSTKRTQKPKRTLRIENPDKSMIDQPNKHQYASKLSDLSNIKTRNSNIAVHFVEEATLTIDICDFVAEQTTSLIWRSFGTITFNRPHPNLTYKQFFDIFNDITDAMYNTKYICFGEEWNTAPFVAKREQIVGFLSLRSNAEVKWPGFSLSATGFINELMENYVKNDVVNIHEEEKIRNEECQAFYQNYDNKSRFEKFTYFMSKVVDITDPVDITSERFRHEFDTLERFMNHEIDGEHQDIENFGDTREEHVWYAIWFWFEKFLCIKTVLQAAYIYNLNQNMLMPVVSNDNDNKDNSGFDPRKVYFQQLFERFPVDNDNGDNIILVKSHLLNLDLISISIKPMEDGAQGYTSFEFEFKNDNIYFTHCKICINKDHFKCVQASGVARGLGQPWFRNTFSLGTTYLHERAGHSKARLTTDLWRRSTWDRVGMSEVRKLEETHLTESKECPTITLEPEGGDGIEYSVFECSLGFKDGKITGKQDKFQFEVEIDQLNSLVRKLLKSNVEDLYDFDASAMKWNLHRNYGKTSSQLIASNAPSNYQKNLSSPLNTKTNEIDIQMSDIKMKNNSSIVIFDDNNDINDDNGKSEMLTRLLVSTEDEEDREARRIYERLKCYGVTLSDARQKELGLPKYTTKGAVHMAIYNKEKEKRKQQQQKELDEQMIAAARGDSVCECCDIL